MCGLCRCAIRLLPSQANLEETFLSMIMDSGAEEHAVSLAGWRLLGEPSLATCSSALAQCHWWRPWECLAVLLCVVGVRTSWWS